MTDQQSRIVQLEAEVAKLKIQQSARQDEPPQRRRRVWPWVVVLVFALGTYFGMPMLTDLATAKFGTISEDLSTGN